MLNRVSFCFPTQIRFGPGVIRELGSHLRDKNLKRPLLVCDSGIAKLDFMDQITEDIKSNKIGPVLFSEIQPNPIKSDVLAGKRAYLEGDCDAILGIGGGASMDVARSIALAAHHDRDLFDFEDAKGGEHLVTGKIPYFVTVPTTSGTGSEVGRSSVISDDEAHAKKILYSPRLMATQVFADPELTLGLPPKITAATGIDALTHHLEAYLSKGFHPMCDGIALEGIRLVGESLEKAVNSGQIEARSKMMAAAMTGAVAFQKGLGLVHSMAHALSSHKNLHHGLANAVMLSAGLEFNASVASERMTRICKILSLPNPGPATLIRWIRVLYERIGVPARLETLGLNSEDVKPLAALAMDDPCHNCNPKPVRLQDFEELFRNSL